LAKEVQNKLFLLNLMLVVQATVTRNVRFYIFQRVCTLLFSTKVLKQKYKIGIIYWRWKKDIAKVQKYYILQR